MKKKTKIIIASVAAVMLLGVSGVFIWYLNSPFRTAVKLMSAMRDKNMSAMLDCIEPEKAEMINMMFSYFGIDSDSLFDMITQNSSGNFDRSKTSFKFSGYHREGDRAYMEMEITDNATGDVNTRKIDFVRIKGKWYLTFSFYQ